MQVLLVLHGPDYWKWLIPCGTLYLCDLMLRFAQLRRHTVISRVQILAPRYYIL